MLGNEMPHIFIAMSGADENFAAKITALIRHFGFAIYTRSEVGFGETWKEAVGRRLEEAQSVVVVWSRYSVDDMIVLYEASYAKSLGKLISVVVDGSQPPLGFLDAPIVRAGSWDGNPNSDFAQRLLAKLKGTDHVAPNLQPLVVAQKVNSTPPPAALQDTAYPRLLKRQRPNLFISHATGDKLRIAPIVRVLIESGFNPWIDTPAELGLPEDLMRRLTGIQIGDDWQRSIRDAISTADIVLTFWSKDAADARRFIFHYEVYLGLITHKLFQSKIDAMAPDDIGTPYTFRHIADLSRFSAHQPSVELAKLLTDMINHIARKRSAWHSFTRGIFRSRSNNL